MSTGSQQYILVLPDRADPLAVLSASGDLIWAAQLGVDTMLVSPTPKALALPCIPITNGRYVSGTPDLGKLCAGARQSGVKTLGQLLRHRKRVERRSTEPAVSLKRRPTTHGRENLKKGAEAAAKATRKVTAEDLRKAAEFRAQGVSWRLIGAALRMSPDTLKSAARRQAVARG